MGKPGKPGGQGMKSSINAPARGHVVKRKFQIKGKPGFDREEADNKKRAVIRQYKKILHKESRAQGHQHKQQQLHKSSADFAFGAKDQEQGTSKAFGVKKGTFGKKSRFHKEEQIKQRKEQEKIKQQMEKEEEFEKRKAALQNYKHKKRQSFKKLSKVNYKGQPNLSAQMELLLNKIEQQKHG